MIVRRMDKNRGRVQRISEKIKLMKIGMKSIKMGVRKTTCVYKKKKKNIFANKIK